MSINLVRWTVSDVGTSTVGSPSGDVGSKVLVRIGDAPVVLFLERVFRRTVVRIAALPEIFDEFVELLISVELVEVGPFLVGDDVGYVLVQPLRPGSKASNP